MPVWIAVVEWEGRLSTSQSVFFWNEAAKGALVHGATNQESGAKLVSAFVVPEIYQKEYSKRRTDPRLLSICDFFPCRAGSSEVNAVLKTWLASRSKISGTIFHFEVILCVVWHVLATVQASLVPSPFPCLKYANFAAHRLQT